MYELDRKFFNSDWLESDPTSKRFIQNKPNVTTNDDLRLSNSREWIAPTVTFEEAIAGDSNERRAFTPFRVRNAIENIAVPRAGGNFAGAVSFKDSITVTSVNFDNTDDNVLIGKDVLAINNRGKKNTAVGFRSLASNTDGSHNTSIGYNSFFNNTTGKLNAGVGSRALFENISGEYNTAIGALALFSNTTGSKNASYGSRSLFANVEGSKNTVIGYEAGQSATGSGNVLIGHRAGFNAVGDNNLYIANTGTSNPLILGNFSTSELQVNGSLVVSENFEVLGTSELTTLSVNKIENISSITYKDSGTNFFLGEDALINNTTGVANVAIGSFTLTNNTTGKENTAIGRFSLTANTDGFNNTAVGFNSLLSNIDGDLNSALGDNTLASNTSGSENLALGSSALRDNTTGNGNISLGTRALLKNISGDFNTAIGSGSLASNTTGEGNTAIGRAALNKNITGFNNLAFGKNALGLSEQGISNIAIGSGAGLNCLGSGNIFLGSNAGQNETGSNKLYISNTNTSTPLMLGDFSAQELQVNGDLTVTENLEVLGFVESDSFKSSIIQGDRFNTVEIVVDDDLVDVVTPANGGAFVLMYTGANNEPAPQVDSSAMVYYNVGDNPALRSNDAGDGVTIVNNNNPNSIIPNTIVIGADQGIIRIRSTWGDPIIIRMTFIV